MKTKTHKKRGSQAILRYFFLTALALTSIFSIACSQNSGTKGTQRPCVGSNCSNTQISQSIYSENFRSALSENRDIQLALDFFTEDQRRDDRDRREDRQSRSDIQPVSGQRISAQGTLFLNQSSWWGDCEIISGDYDITTDASGSLDYSQTVRSVRLFATGPVEMELTLDYAMFTQPRGGSLLSCDDKEYSYAMLTQISITRSDGYNCSNLGVPKIFLASFNGSPQFSCQRN